MRSVADAGRSQCCGSGVACRWDCARPSAQSGAREPPRAPRAPRGPARKREAVRGEADRCGARPSRTAAAGRASPARRRRRSAAGGPRRWPRRAQTQLHVVRPRRPAAAAARAAGRPPTRRSCAAAHRAVGHQVQRALGKHDRPNAAPLGIARRVERRAGAVGESLAPVSRRRGPVGAAKPGRAQEVWLVVVPLVAPRVPGRVGAKGAHQAGRHGREHGHVHERVVLGQAHHRRAVLGGALQERQLLAQRREAVDGPRKRPVASPSASDALVGRRRERRAWRSGCPCAAARGCPKGRPAARGAPSPRKPTGSRGWPLTETPLLRLAHALRAQSSHES